MLTSVRHDDATPGASPRFKTLALVLAALSFIGIFTLPYYIPVQPVFSVSYITGYNNRAAFALFAASAALLAYALSSVVPRQAVSDRRLHLWTLLLALLVVAAALLFVIQRHGNHGGSESAYQLERLSHLIAGQSMYRQFEYIYGPLLLYPAYWVHIVTGWAAQPSCRLAWALEWFAGTVMLWFAVGKNAIPVRQRTLLFFLYFLLALGGVFSEGLNETPFRSLSSASLCVGVFVLWQRTHSSYFKTAIALIAVALGYAISPEHGIALAFGLCTYALWLSIVNRSLFHLPAVLLLWAGSACIVLIAIHLGELNTARTAAAGGLNFPLLPSPMQLFTLTVYLAGALSFYQALAGRITNTAVVPLGLCGLPLLLYAFGRCDSGHLLGSPPLYLVGLFALFRWPRLDGAYVLLVTYFFLLPMANRYRKMGSPHPSSMIDTNSRAVDHANVIDTNNPATRYFAPLSVPMSEDGQILWHADSGFYFGTCDVTSPATMQAKADEIERRRAPLLILPETGQPLRLPFWVTDLTPDALHSLEGSPWVPRQIRPQLDGANVVATIQRLYEPTAQQQDGWRVWKLRQQP